MEPNQDQVMSIVRSTIAVVSGWAISKGYGDSQLWLMIGGLAGVIVPYIWGVYAHTNAAKLAAIVSMPRAEKNATFNQISDGVKLASVEAMPAVKRIVVSSAASNGVADAANDTNRPKITYGV
jgi:hypothetical protein